MHEFRICNLIHVKKCDFSPLKIKNNKITTSLCISSDSFNMIKSQFVITISFNRRKWESGIIFPSTTTGFDARG